MVAVVEKIGNIKGNSYFEATLPSSQAIGPAVSSERRARFIRAKYEQKRWFAMPDQAPVTETPALFAGLDVAKTETQDDVNTMFTGLALNGPAGNSRSRASEAAKPTTVLRSHAASPWVTKPGLTPVSISSPAPAPAPATPAPTSAPAPAPASVSTDPAAANLFGGLTLAGTPAVAETSLNLFDSISVVEQRTTSPSPSLSEFDLFNSNAANASTMQSAQPAAPQSSFAFMSTPSEVGVAPNGPLHVHDHSTSSFSFMQPQPNNNQPRVINSDVFFNTRTSSSAAPAEASQGVSHGAPAYSDPFAGILSDSSTHGTAPRNNGKPRSPVKGAKACAVEGCDNVRVSRGCCSRHVNTAPSSNSQGNHRGNGTSSPFGFVQTMVSDAGKAPQPSFDFMQSSQQPVQQTSGFAFM